MGPQEWLGGFRWGRGPAAAQRHRRVRGRSPGASGRRRRQLEADRQGPARSGCVVPEGRHSGYKLGQAGAGDGGGESLLPPPSMKLKILPIKLHLSARPSPSSSHRPCVHAGAPSSLFFTQDAPNPTHTCGCLALEPVATLKSVKPPADARRSGPGLPRSWDHLAVSAFLSVSCFRWVTWAAPRAGSSRLRTERLCYPCPPETGHHRGRLSVEGTEERTAWRELGQQDMVSTGRGRRGRGRPSGRRRDAALAARLTTKEAPGQRACCAQPTCPPLSCTQFPTHI